MLSSSRAFLFRFHSVISSFLRAVNLDPGFLFLKPFDGWQGVAGPWASLRLSWLRGGPTAFLSQIAQVWESDWLESRLCHLSARQVFLG